MNYQTKDALEIEKALAWTNKRWNKPVDVEYFHPRSLEEAVVLLQRYAGEARLIAGGTDLVGLLKNKVISPAVLIDIKTVPGLHFIEDSENGLNLGASVLIHEMENSALLKEKYPLLAETASQIGSAQIRNMGTLAGNLCQQVRCWYYRRTPDTGIAFNCRRKNEKGACYAVEGENQDHAVLGGNHCFAVCPSDMAVALSSLDARISTSGARVVPISEFYTPMGNVLEFDEFITGITVPSIASETKQRFLKFRVRKTIDFAVASVAAVVFFKDDLVSDARIVLGGVSSVPYRALRAEEILKGKPLTASLAAQAAKEAVAGARPLSKNSHKVQIAETLVKRALL